MGKFLEFNCTVALAFNSSDDGDKLFVGRIIPILLEKAVKIEVCDGTLLLTIEHVEGCERIPVGTLVDLELHHLHLNMHVKFPLKEVSQATLYRLMQFLSIFWIYLECLPLASIFSELGIITRQDKLHELTVAKTTAVVQVVELHHELHVFY